MAVASGVDVDAATGRDGTSHPVITTALDEVGGTKTSAELQIAVQRAPIGNIIIDRTSQRILLRGGRGLNIGHIAVDRASVGHIEAEQGNARPGRRDDRVCTPPMTPPLALLTASTTA